MNHFKQQHRRGQTQSMPTNFFRALGSSALTSSSCRRTPPPHHRRVVGNRAARRRLRSYRNSSMPPQAADKSMGWLLRTTTHLPPSNRPAGDNCMSPSNHLLASTSSTNPTPPCGRQRTNCLNSGALCLPTPAPVRPGTLCSWLRAEELCHPDLGKGADARTRCV